MDRGEAIYKTLAALQLAQAALADAEAMRQKTVFNAAEGYFVLSGAAGEEVRISVNYAVEVKVAVEAGIAFKGDLYWINVQAAAAGADAAAAAHDRPAAACRATIIFPGDDD